MMQTSSTTDKEASPERSRPSAPSKIDFWIILDLLASRWVYLLVGFLLGGIALGLAGAKFIRPKFTSAGQLLRYTTPGASDLFNREPPMSAETFGGLLVAPDLLRRAGEFATPPLTPELLVKRLKVEPDDESDLVNASLAAPTPQEAVDLLNVYLTNAVQYLRDLQSSDVRAAAHVYLNKQVTQMDDDIAALDAKFRALAAPPLLTNKIAQISSQLNQLSNNLAASARPTVVAMQTERLNQALGELAELLSKYTEIHPLVRQKEDEVQALKTAIAAQPPTPAPQSAQAAPASTTPAPAQPTYNPELDIIRAKLLSLEEARAQLINHQREAELYASNPPGAARVFASANTKTVRPSLRGVKIGIAAVVGGLLGLAASLCLIALVEFTDNRMKTAADVRRVTRLPVLTTLGDVKSMNDEAKSQWAFRAWTMLQGRLSPSPQHGLVCGFTSSATGEGRSTLIHLLAEAASLTGFRVLTVATRPTPGEAKPNASALCELLPDALQAKDPAEALLPATTSDVLSSPDQVANQLTSPNSDPVVHIPLPGWIWNRQRRQQWHDALHYWRKIENLVILVELPPADVAETVLLGSSLPNLVWISDGSVADAASTRDQLETLRDAKCNIVGAVMNRESATPLKKRFPRWVGCAILWGALATHACQAQELASPTNSSNTNLSFSIVNPSQRADWQKHLTLGAGDVLNFGLFGQPDVSLSEVAIAPDGRVSYLEALDVMAAGLTIDELRARMDDELAKYRRAPHTLITPVAFRSKKYYMLGRIMVKGAYILDRPMTVLEAIARAKGFENGLVNRSVVDLADFSRSFIIRDGKRVPLNFENLFEAGDLSQNVPIEPGDCVYIASASVQDVYVVGEVRLAGPVTYFANQTVVAAITARGGFTDRAYQGRVVVVRGSINHPETYLVNLRAILHGEGPDFKLQPRDIIYVSHRPFIRVEELTDLATTAFIQGLITAWVDVRLVKPSGQ